MYFQTFNDDNGFIYSLDNVRLSFDCGSNDGRLVSYFSHIDTYDDRFKIKYFHSLKSFTFRHLWTIFLTEDVSFSLALAFNSVGKESNTKGWIDFNPNKCEKFSHFHEVLSFITSLCFSIDLVRYDLAIDLPFMRSSCKMIKQGKKLYSYLVKDDGVTEYSGRRSTSGFIKLYDKTKESKLDYPLTRLEITLDKTTDLRTVFPEVWIYDKQNSLILDDSLSNTQKVLVMLLRESEIPAFHFSQLDRPTKIKLRPFLTDKVLACYSLAWLHVRRLALSYEKNGSADGFSLQEAGVATPIECS